MKKVAIGCGIALLVILALTIAAFVFGTRWMKGQLAGMERYEHAKELMVETYGPPEDFQPPADGEYDPDRVALFARLCGQINVAGSDFVRGAEDLADYGEKGWFRDMRTMMSIVNDGMNILGTADSLLMDAQMSRGEYIHYQTLMLEGFLDDSPGAFLDGDPGEVRNSKFYEAFEGFESEYRSETQRLLQAQARNARTAAQDSTCDSCEEWVAYLSDQLESARAQRRYVAMSDPLPGSLAAAFEAHRSELESTRPTGYGTWLLTILMALELDDDEGNFQVRFSD